jgi:hypothetical protein
VVVVLVKPIEFRDAAPSRDVQDGEAVESQPNLAGAAQEQGEIVYVGDGRR